MRLLDLLNALIVVSVTSFVVTWYLALKLKLDWMTLFAIFTGLLLLNRVAFTYFFPLRVLQEFAAQLSGLRIFGIALFGAGTGFVNIYLLYKRFGLISGLALSFLPPLVAEMIASKIEI
jgi:hypothetical protein